MASNRQVDMRAGWVDAEVMTHHKTNTTHIKSNNTVELLRAMESLKGIKATGEIKVHHNSNSFSSNMVRCSRNSCYDNNFR